MNEIKTEKVEAATFKRLVKHLQENPNIQNIDLMELAGFCRNCISKWYTEEAGKHGTNIDYEKARNLVYGMSYKEWKVKHQKEQTNERLESLKETFHDH